MPHGIAKGTLHNDRAPCLSFFRPQTKYFVLYISLSLCLHFDNFNIWYDFLTFERREYREFLYQGRRRRGAGGGGLCTPPLPLSKVGSTSGFLPPPPSFGQIKCSNFAIWSYFVVKNAKFSSLAPLANLALLIFIRPTCRNVLWYGAGVCPSGRLSVGLSTKLVNTIETEPFQLGPSNLVYTLLMTRGRTLLIFKVRGQRSRSQATHSC